MVQSVPVGKKIMEHPAVSGVFHYLFAHCGARGGSGNRVRFPVSESIENRGFSRSEPVLPDSEESFLW